MASLNENDIEIPNKSFTFKNRSVSLSNPTSTIERFDYSSVVLGYTGPLRTKKRRPPLVQISGPFYSTHKQEPLFVPSPIEKPSSAIDMPSQEDYSVFRNPNLLRSGQLGICNDPYCTTCPSYYNSQAVQYHTSKVSSSKFHTALYDDARGYARRFASSDKKCIEIDWCMTKVLVSVRCVTDFIFFINILLQFRLAYVAPESRVVGAGQLVDHPRKIARNYFLGKFILDLIILVPLPQIMILWVIPEHIGIHRAEYERNIIRAGFLFQYIPKLYRLLPLLAGQTATSTIFESAWINFFVNLLTFVLAGHAVGSFWYLAGLQRVKKCLLHAENISVDARRNLIDCARVSDASKSLQDLWKHSESVGSCFQEDGFTYGIYLKAVNLTKQSNYFERYSYSLFWGFQQISTLAGNQVPSYSLGEVFFTMGIIGLGLLLFARLIGNMHNFLQSLDRRRMEMMLRRRDVEQWMSHRLLPEDIRKRVREAERFNWAATRGVNEDLFFENMPEDLHRDIKRHLFKFLKKVRIFSLMDESILDAIRERLKQRTYIRSSTVLHRGGLIEKMVFIVRGEMESIGEDGYVLPLSEGDVCGEELLTWCLERSSINPNGTRTKMPLKGLVSSRNVRCVTNVEAFSLSVADLEDVTSLFSRILRSNKVQGAIKYDSPYWRLRATMQIQVAWRYRRRRLHGLIIHTN
ncbi:unnamed protein product [Cochlearia groenlandica]